MEQKNSSLHIAICDDQHIICEALAHLVDIAFLGTDYEYSYHSFLSGEHLLAHLNSGNHAFQVYLLDIEMEGIDGMKTAEQIRKKDKDAVIIFITSHVERMSQAFHVLAFGYLVKPLNDESVIATLHSAIRLLRQRKAIYTYSLRKRIYSVPLAQIEYFESLGRKIVIHMSNGEKMEYNGSLKETMSKVEGIPFARAHNSFVVNLEQVALLESWQVQLQSGTKIAIGKRYHASFHSGYRAFIRGV
ncbi:LytR/AlgR family response regulator transcription factor [Enterococcus sp. LJL128]|uniref:LytR/AlgR family response regulator transcription factor n=1 Tax=Enterococcus sp. LJL51 TaxID=3416656 RepID=UPI003CF056B1